MRTAFAFAMILIATPVVAAERGYSVTDFERIRAEGPFAITVEAGRGATARASGTLEALDRVDVQVQGRTLVIRPNRSAWGGWPGKQVAAASIRVTVPNLTVATFSGSGSLKISQMKGPRLSVFADGSGSVGIGKVEGERVDATLQGSGSVSIAGKSAQGFITSTGSGNFDAAGFAVQDLTILARTSGNIKAAASRAAKITATGSGNVTIDGKPACTVSNIGSGDVVCGDGTASPASDQ